MICPVVPSIFSHQVRSMLTSHTIRCWDDAGTGNVRDRLFARVETIVNRAEPGLEHVRVNLRRRQIRMAEHDLDRAEIRAALEQVRGERVPEDVWAQVAADTRFDAIVLEHLPKANSRQRTSARV